MKKMHKGIGFPYGTSFRYAKSPLRLLTKLPAKQAFKLKQRSLVFSLELGRSVRKRVLWQVSTGLPKNSMVLGKTDRTSAWSVFLSAFFRKMWLLNNASAVPGIVWPAKNKRKLIAKIKAFKALNLSLGGFQTKCLVKNIQKVYSDSFSATSHSFVWKMASSLDSFKSSFFTKLGFFLTSGNAKKNLPMISTGFNQGNFQVFLYPGDFHSFLNKSDFFAHCFSVGPQVSKKFPFKNQPFWFLKSFYNPAFVNKKKKNSGMGLERVAIKSPKKVF